MKKDQLYLFTFLGLALIIFIVSYFSMSYLFETATSHFLKNQIESSKREANEISNLVQYQLESGLTKETVIQDLQKGIEGSNTESGFISLLDWSGFQICHPDSEQIGRQIIPDESFLRPISEELEPNDFYEFLKEKTKVKNTAYLEKSTEIIYLYPVKNSDWIVAAHADIDNLKKQMQNLKINFILVYIASGVLIVLLSLFLVRLISRKYELELEHKNEGLSKEVLSLSKLNRNLITYKEKVDLAQSSTTKQTSNENQGHSKRRILTYVKDILVAIDTQEISFIYTENTITYICCLDGKVYNSNSSLDELLKDLDNTYFFRANRQFILSINAIEKIYKYGNNQLKIDLNPPSVIPIIVSKNKASDFKKWLGS